MRRPEHSDPAALPVRVRHANLMACGLILSVHCPAAFAGGDGVNIQATNAAAVGTAFNHMI
ncbi:MAG: hypothetical protein ABI307_00940 [Mycobacterium sp.]